MKLFLKYLFLLVLGGSIYYCMEILFRGYSHYSMFILGGVCFILMGLINELLSWDTYIEVQILIGTGSTLILEFITGCIVNLYLNLNVWDYSDLPFNLLGQVCLSFAFLWMPLTLIGILLDDYIRYKFFNEEEPRYTSYIIEKTKCIK